VYGRPSQVTPNVSGSRAAPSNKGMKLTKPERVGALQLIPGVLRTWLGERRPGCNGVAHGRRR
jgi:hypothetical protein